MGTPTPYPAEVKGRNMYSKDLKDNGGIVIAGGGAVVGIIVTITIERTGGAVVTDGDDHMSVLERIRKVAPSI